MRASFLLSPSRNWPLLDLLRKIVETTCGTDAMQFGTPALKAHVAFKKPGELFLAYAELSLDVTALTAENRQGTLLG
jgi:hypothetical protein